MVAPTGERIDHLSGLLKERRVASFFDFDGTTSERQLLIEFMLRIPEKFPERRSMILPLEEALLRYKKQRTYDYRPVLTAAIEAIGPVFKGLPEREVRKLASEIVAEFGEMTYLFPRTLLAYLRERSVAERGLIIGITGSPREIAEPFGAQLGFDLVIGMEYEVANGVYTGTIDERTAHDKGGIVDELTSRFTLDLSQSVALGDSESDVPMLDRVGHPFAVNPHDKLLTYARGNRRVVWVNDRQKNGVMMFRAAFKRRFLEIKLHEALPCWVENFPVLPGSIT